MVRQLLVLTGGKTDRSSDHFQSTGNIFDKDGGQWGSVEFEYKLPAPIVLDEPHFCKLVGVVGPQVTVCVYANFVGNQPDHGRYAPLVGVRSHTEELADNDNIYVPIVSREIPSTGIIELVSFGKQLRKLDFIAVILYIVPAKDVECACKRRHGTHC